MPLEILTRFRDAMSMFWDSLNSEEKRYLIYVAVYLGATTLATVSKKASDRNKAEMLAEMRAMIEERNGTRT